MTDYYILNDADVPVPVDVRTWSNWFETNRDRKIIAQEYETGDMISTVFLGLDHSFGEGPPLLYETMVFGGEHDGDMDRYTTREEALAGHARMVAKVRGERTSARTEPETKKRDSTP